MGNAKPYGDQEYGPLVCPFCKCLFGSDSSFAKHVKAVHGDMPRPEPEPQESESEPEPAKGRKVNHRMDVLHSLRLNEVVPIAEITEATGLSESAVNKIVNGARGSNYVIESVHGLAKRRTIIGYKYLGRK